MNYHASGNKSRFLNVVSIFEACSKDGNETNSSKAPADDFGNSEESGVVSG
jgi:hypothetical protein